MSNDDRTTEERTRALLRQFDEPEQHLDPDREMIPYVDGTLDAADVAIVESHLEDCAMCRAEVDDLRRVAHAPRRGGWRVFAVAASLLIAFLLAIFIARSRGRVPIATTTTQPRPAPPIHAYANAEWARLVDDALDSGRLPIPAEVEELQRAEVVLRGLSPARRIELAPSGVAIDTTRPRFTWPSTPGAAYTVFVFAGDDEVANSGRLSRNEWAPERDLARGRTYAWQVESTRNGVASIMPTPEPARFRIIGTREHAEVEAARAAHGGDALLMAVVFARAGLVAEAREELAKLASSRDPRVERLARNYIASPSRTNAPQ